MEAEHHDVVTVDCRCLCVGIIHANDMILHIHVQFGSISIAGQIPFFFSITYPFTWNIAIRLMCNGSGIIFITYIGLDV